MAKAKQGAAAGKKSGATKKGAAAEKGLEVIEGGKGKGAKAAASTAPGAPLLKDGKTAANPEALKRALGVYGVSFKPDATPAELLAAVRKHLGKVLKDLPDEEKVKCTAVCGEVSTNDTDFCPYCGDEGVEEGDDPGAAEAAEATAPAAAPAKAESTAIAPASTGDALAAATAKLDESIARINRLRADLAANSYDLGLEIRKIHEEELWKARGHESFKDFIEKELEIGRSMAYRLIDVTKQFDRPTFEQVGSHKLALIAGIQDSEARDAALEAAKAGASTKDVERAVNEAKGRTPAPPKEKGGSSAGGTSAPAKKTAQDITLLTKVGSKPQLIGFRSASSGRPINHHKDDAYAELQLSDDVKQRIALKIDKEGNIVGVTVAFVRV